MDLRTEGEVREKGVEDRGRRSEEETRWERKEGRKGRGGKDEHIHHR